MALSRAWLWVDRTPSRVTRAAIAHEHRTGGYWPREAASSRTVLRLEPDRGCHARRTPAQTVFRGSRMLLTGRPSAAPGRRSATGPGLRWPSTSAVYVGGSRRRCREIDARGIPTGTHRDLDAYLDHLLAVHPVGPPERCIERLTDTLSTTGVRHHLLMVEAAGRPDRTLETIARLGTEVIPKLRAAC
jgi:hypothetical protein